MPPLVGNHRAARASLLRPAVHARLVEEAVEDQLPAPVEEVEQAHWPVRSLELVLLLDEHPRHPAALGRHRVARVGELLLLDQQRVVRLLPFLLTDDRR